METKKILNNERYLLEQKDSLFLDKVIIEDELREINKNIDNYVNEKDFYKKIKKELIKKYAKNITQVTGTGLFVDAPFHILSNNFDSFMNSDYIIGGCILYTIVILTIDLNYELNNYKKNNNLKLNVLKLKRKELEKSRMINQDNINSVMEKLDEIYESLIPGDVKVKKYN